MITMINMPNNPFLELKKCSARLYKISTHKAKSTEEFSNIVKMSNIEIDRISAYLNKIKRFNYSYIDKEF